MGARRGAFLAAAPRGCGVAYGSRCEWRPTLGLGAPSRSGSAAVPCLRLRRHRARCGCRARRGGALALRLRERDAPGTLPPASAAGRAPWLAEFVPAAGYRRLAVRALWRAQRRTCCVSIRGLAVLRCLYVAFKKRCWRPTQYARTCRPGCHRPDSPGGYSSAATAWWPSSSTASKAAGGSRVRAGLRLALVAGTRIGGGLAQAVPWCATSSWRRALRGGARRPARVAASWRRRCSVLVPAALLADCNWRCARAIGLRHLPRSGACSRRSPWRDRRGSMPRCAGARGRSRPSRTPSVFAHRRAAVSTRGGWPFWLAAPWRGGAGAVCARSARAPLATTRCHAARYSG